MTDLDQLPATRTVLLDLRRELEDAREGRAILERKREVLLRELWGLLREIRQTEREVRERFAAAFALQKEARLVMGMEAMQFAALAPAAETVCSIETRSVMGVELPLASIEVRPLPLPYSPAGISSIFDELRTKWIEAAKTLGPWIEMNGSIWRVAAELELTQRRVNALDHLLIPQYQSAVARIQTVLEEQERESFLRAKRVKDRAGPGRN
jgi:V/A-type H+/Na+-transporting ATPase subunit D